MVGMTQNDDQTAQPVREPSGIDRFFGWLRALDFRRQSDDKWLAGVCSGIATRLGVDPLIIRAALIVLILFGGIGITLYLIAWAFVPNERNEIIAERAIRDGDFWGIALLVVLAITLVGGSGFVDGGGWGFWWLWWVLIPVGVIVWMVSRNKDPEGARERARVASERATTWSQDVSTRAVAVSDDISGRASSWGTGGQAPGGAGGSNAPGAPGAPVAPPRAPRPPRPPRPRRRSAGFIGFVLVAGLALAAYGLALWAHDGFAWSGSREVVALAAALSVTGAGVLGMGLAGLKTGLTGFMAIVLALLTWSASVLPQVDVGGGIGDRTWRPSATDGTEAYRLGIGSASLFLGDLPTAPAAAGHMEASVGVGELRIYVPEDLTVEIRSDVSGGTIREANGWHLDENGQWTEQGPSGRSISTTEVIGTGTPDLILEASVGLGEIIVSKE